MREFSGQHAVQIIGQVDEPMAVIGVSLRLSGCAQERPQFLVLLNGVGVARFEQRVQYGRCKNRVVLDRRGFEEGESSCVIAVRPESILRPPQICLLNPFVVGASRTSLVAFARRANNAMPMAFPCVR